MHTIIRDNYDPIPNEYHETIVVDEARGKRWLFDCDGIFHDITKINVVSERGDSEDYAASQKWVTEEVESLQDNLDAEEAARTAADEALQDNIDAEKADRAAADTEIWNEIEALEAASDVVDVVGTYAELENYDTSALQDNDIIKVLQDETHDDAVAYYRWDTATEAFTFVGVEGPYYTASETDTLLAGKQDKLIAGNNIQIAADGKTISATDTTYTRFTGATASADGVQGLVPVPLAGDQNKVLKGDGTWGDASAYTLPPATTTTLGGIIVGNNLTVDSAGVLNATGTSYTLPIASAVTLGGVKVGSNLSIDANGILSATDTTYSDFVGTDGVVAGVAGLVPPPATTDAGKFLKADGTWDTVGGEETATTVFYISQVTGSSRFEFWRDSAKTDQVTQSEFITAVQDGPVMLELDWAIGDQSGGHRWIISQSSISEYSGGVSINFTTHGTQTEVAYYTWEYGNTYATRRVNNLEFQLTAGANISISRTTQGTTISAIDTTYTAGTGITIDANNVISAAIPATNNINSTDWNALWQ